MNNNPESEKKRLLKHIINNLDDKTKLEIDKKIKSFKAFEKKNYKAWFSELCYCILTANSKASTALKIQIEMSDDGFIKKTASELVHAIKKYGHRFHNTKAKYILTARNFLRIKGIVQNMKSEEARSFLVKNIKGIGMKEASHFLRNVGRSDVAIIDRHILRFLKQNKLISDIPKTISPKRYLEYETILKRFDYPLDKLDLILWHNITGKVLK